MNDNKYYIVSYKERHTRDIVWYFWRPESKGYTVNLDEAGLFDVNYFNSQQHPIIDKNNKERVLCDKDVCTFLIAQEDIELIGAKITCIMH